jgi:hypothetical protein
MKKKLLSLYIPGMFLLAVTLSLPTIPSQSWEQLEVKNQILDTYSLSFETQPGGVTIELFYADQKIDEKVSSYENSGGRCQFSDLNPGTYHWKASKYEYEPDEGDIELQEDMTHIVILHTVAKIYASVIPRIHNYTKPLTYYEITLIIENRGSSPSYLDWEITDYPDFGSDWIAEKERGEDIPSDGSEVISVSFVSPPKKFFYTFEGTFRIVNLNDPDDVATPSFSLPKNVVNPYGFPCMKLFRLFNMVMVHFNR